MATLAGRPTSSYRPRRSAPAGPLRWQPGQQWSERPGLAQFVYLAMLLHAIAILLFGAPPGGSRDGRAMWGSLNVVLQGPASDIVIPSRLEPLPAMQLPRLARELKMPPPATVKPAPKTEAPRVEAPLIVPPMMERLEAPALKLDKAVPTPKIEVVPVPAPAPVAVPAPMQPLAPDLPRVERTLAEPPKIEAPIAQPVVPPPPVTRPVEVAAPPIAVPAPMQPMAPEAPRIERTLVEPPKLEAPRIAAPPVPVPIPVVPAPIEKPAPRASEGYDPTQPSVDMDAVRRRAAQMAREGSGQRALLPFPMPAPPERKTKTEEALDKARKPDCRTAYQELGLLAAVPLIANEFGEGTCRW